MYAQEISASRFVELCLGVVMSEIITLLYTHNTPHTHIILPQNVTNNFFLYTTRRSHSIF